MDLDGDGVITEAEFAKYTHEHRSCNTCWSGDGDNDDKKKDPPKAADPPPKGC